MRAAGLLSLLALELLAISPTAPEGCTKTLTPCFPNHPPASLTAPLVAKLGPAITSSAQLRTKLLDTFMLPAKSRQRVHVRKMLRAVGGNGNDCARSGCFASAVFLRHIKGGVGGGRLSREVDVCGKETDGLRLADTSWNELPRGLRLPWGSAFSRVWSVEAFRSPSRPTFINPTTEAITLVYTEKA